jgi:hypothetical protein
MRSKPLPRKQCAHVGYTGSVADKVRFEEVLGWLRSHRPDELRSYERLGVVKFDLMYQGDPDPLYGSDFLLDRRLFDTVVLHYIFAGWDEMETLRRPAIGEHPYFSVSPKHSPEAWRRRLRACGARRVFAFGGAFEVASFYLLTIRGYQKIVTPFGAVFERYP